MSSSENVDFMRRIEEGYQAASGYRSRAHYKIFYGQVKPAKVLTLGINPGGDPTKISDDGTTSSDGSIASASASFFENDEHDVIDCEWKENYGLRKLILPIIGNSIEQFRSDVVKTNLAFRRSVKKSHIDMRRAIDEASPFLHEILHRVNPEVVLLTGAPIEHFNRCHAKSVSWIVEPEVHPKVHQVIFAATESVLSESERKVTVV